LSIEVFGGICDFRICDGCHPSVLPGCAILCWAGIRAKGEHKVRPYGIGGLFCNIVSPVSCALPLVFRIVLPGCVIWCRGESCIRPWHH
jgi:hypothetical protein